MTTWDLPIINTGHLHNVFVKLFKNLKADVVFLGVGLLGNKPEQYTKRLWQNAVENTNASLVIPVHWDNLTKKIDNEIPAIPWYADNLKQTMTRLTAYAQKNKRVKIQYPPPYKPFLL